MHLADATLNDLEAKTLHARDILSWGGSDLDGVEVMQEYDSIVHTVFYHSLDLIEMAREVNFWSNPDNKKARVPMGANERAIFDLDMPDFVRAFIAMMSLPAMETGAIRNAGLMPKLYGRHKGQPVRVVMVSRLGDIGVSREDKEFGYYLRCSIYDVTDYTTEMPS